MTGMGRQGSGVRGIGAWLALCIAPALAPDALAHGGGLDRHGCHNDRKRGGYHCHRGAPPTSRADIATPRDTAPASFAPANTAPVRPAHDRAYANCAEARAAGAAPVRRGDPGYGPHLDRDGDGVGCEPRRR